MYARKNGERSALAALLIGLLILAIHSIDFVDTFLTPSVTKVLAPSGILTGIARQGAALSNKILWIVQKILPSHTSTLQTSTTTPTKNCSPPPSTMEQVHSSCVSQDEGD